MARSRSRKRGQRRFERHRDAPAHAAAAVFGREHELHAEAFEEIEIEQLAGAARAVEQRGRRARGAQRFGERRKRREPDAAGHHPRFARRRSIVNGLPSGPRQPTRSPGSSA